MSYRCDSLRRNRRFRASSRHEAAERSVAMHCHLGTDRAGRATPDFDQGDERRAATTFGTFSGKAQDSSAVVGQKCALWKG